MTDKLDGAREAVPGTIKVIGIGQSFRGDDAAGLEAVRYWQKEYRPDIERPDVLVEFAELPGIDLLSLLEGARTAILVDAVQSNSQIGMIHLVSNDELESFASPAGSAHGWGVAETLSLGQQLMPAAMPGKLLLIGIEAGDFALGKSLSPAVELALPEAARLIQQLVNSG